MTVSKHLALYSKRVMEVVQEQEPNHKGYCTDLESSMLAWIELWLEKKGHHVSGGGACGAYGPHICLRSMGRCCACWREKEPWSEIESLAISEELEGVI